MKIHMEKISKNLYWVVITVLSAIALFVAVSFLHLPGGISLFAVQSGSMQPSLKTGSLIISKKADKYQVGDVITFKYAKTTVTHRIYSIGNSTGQTTFTTKGDANNAPDSEKVSSGMIIGKEVLTIPYIGYLLSLFRTKNGLFVLIILGVTIVLNEISNIAKESVKLIHKRSKNSQPHFQKLNISGIC
jgi:signal peptidase I